MNKVKIIIFVALIALITSKAHFILHSHSGSWCDFWTGSGLVNVQVVQKGLSHSKNVTFNMTVQDSLRNRYNANCTIEQLESESGKLEEDGVYNESIKNVPRAYCYFDPPILSDDLTYRKNSLAYTTNNTNNTVEIANDFYIIAQKCTSKKKAEKTGVLTLSFRQLTSFKQLDDTITFILYGLTTRPLKKDIKIVIYIYLYLKGGIREKEPRPINCTLEEDVNTDSSPAQAPFKCRIEGLEKKYHTIKFSSSEDISGVPDNETLLDPKLTDEAIIIGTVPNYTQPEKQKEVPALITLKDIITDTCESEGTYIIKANTTENITNKIELSIPMTYPFGIESICTIPPSTAGQEIDIECKYKGDSENQALLFEQRTITIGKKQYLFGKVQSNKTTCKNVEVIDNEKKFNSSLSFRQIRGFKHHKNDGKIGFKFFGLTTKNITKNNSVIIIYVYLLENGNNLNKTLIKATCNLDEDVKLDESKGEQAQADYTCNITGLDTTKNYSSFEFNKSDLIVGIPENKTLLDPNKTDELIIKGLISNYSDPNNKTELPSMFTPISNETVNATNCSENGEFIIVGKLDKNITGPKAFKIPIYYPEPILTNCSLNTTTNGSVELKCKTDKPLVRKGIMMEQQILRIGEKEILTLGKVKSKGEIYCNIPISPPNKTDLPEILLSEDEKIEELKNKPEIKISFRQMRKFEHKDGKITFIIFILATETLKKGDKIRIRANLIKKSGEVEKDSKEIPCILNANITPNDGETIQGTFECSLNETEEMYSLRLNSSDSFSIPTEEVLLDPILTENAIKKRKIIDFSIEENSKIMPPIFKFNKMDIKDGKIIIRGKPSKPIKRDLTFVLPLAYPEGAFMTCVLTKRGPEELEFTCLTDRAIENKPIIIERTIIKDGPEEIINLERIITPGNITCPNGLLLEAEKKANRTFSFRQVSRLRKDRDKKMFKFFLASLISKEKKPKDTILILKIFVLIDGVKMEKNATCKLEKEVDPKDKQVQGDFNCEVILENVEEFDKIDFEKNESILISPYNEEITGLSDLNETDLSPRATEIEINITKLYQKDPNNNQTELSECIDYSLDENKDTIPPVLEISSMKDKFECSENGKFTINGKFYSPIDKKMTFMLPLTYPSSKVKCKVNEAKSGEEVEIVCKAQKGFKPTKIFSVENRMLKKRHKEMLFVKSYNKQDFNLPLECRDYNEIKLERAKRKQENKEKLSFFKLSKFQPIEKRIKFFLGLFRIYNKPEFSNFNFEILPIRVEVRKLLNNLRRLDDSETEKLNINCKLTGESKNAAGFDCTSDESVDGTPLNLTLDDDDIKPNGQVISGITDDVQPLNEENGIDYSDPDNLKNIDELPVFSITSMDGSSCEEDGSYVIKGTCEQCSKGKFNNIEIPFSYPDSSGLCNITVEDNNTFNMVCQNKEEFEASTIMFDTMIVKDSNNKEIFKLIEYTNKDKFACIISTNSSEPKPNNETNKTENSETDRPSSTNDTDAPETSTIKDDDGPYNHPTQKKSEGGLSGGAIAAIVICCVIALAIVGALIALGLSKKGSPTPPLQAIPNINNNSSTLNSISYEQKPNVA